MTDRVDSALLKFRASMIVKSAENQFKHCSEAEIRQGMILKAMYFGQKNPNVSMNPFVGIDHQYEGALVEAFFLGSDGRSSNVVGL